MKLDPSINENEYLAYHNKLEEIINDPKANGFDENIIVVCQYLAFYFPVNPPCNNVNNITTMGIVDELSGMVDIDINTVARLMLTIGYRTYAGRSPEWSRMIALFDDDTEFV